MLRRDNRDSSCCWCCAMRGGLLHDIDGVEQVEEDKVTDDADFSFILKGAVREDASYVSEDRWLAVSDKEGCGVGDNSKGILPPDE